MRLLFTGMLVCLTSCTLSFQNIDTHGHATDVVDDVQTNSPKVSPTLTLPLLN